MDEKYAELEDRISRLENAGGYDFSGTKVFSKGVEVKGVLILKEYASDPAPAREGAIAYVNGKLKLCTAGGSSPTWVVVGTQS